MVITLNGEPFEVAGPLSVAELLAALDIDPRRVAVEHNLVVVRRAAFADTTVREGDQIEIVNFVGGGQPAPAAMPSRGCVEPRRGISVSSRRGWGPAAK